jgi:hypothetical protein
MRSQILAFLTLSLLSANLASAEDPRSTTQAATQEAAIASEHEASARQRYHAQLTTIAERDIATALIIRDMAQSQWDVAVRANDPDDAGRWAKRHADALRDERDARARAAYHARERDEARADFAASAARVRKLGARASG